MSGRLERYRGCWRHYGCEHEVLDVRCEEYLIRCEQESTVPCTCARPCAGPALSFRFRFMFFGFGFLPHIIHSLFLSCVCVSVSGVLLCLSVCVCDLLIFLHYTS